jgi:putative DNA primase/helicase
MTLGETLTPRTFADLLALAIPLDLVTFQPATEPAGSPQPASSEDFSADSQIPEEDDDPHRLARIYIRRHKHKGGYGLKFWRQQFWAWDGRRYIQTDAEQIRAELTKSIKLEFDLVWKRKKEEYEAWRTSPYYDENSDRGEPKVMRVTTGIVANAFAALKSLVVLPDIIEPMTWLLDSRSGESRPYISMGNGILNLDALLDLREDCLLPHTPQWFSPISLPYDFDAAATCPKWEDFLTRSMGGDKDRIAILQEWAGYCILPSTDQQKFLFLEGEGANGKSVYMAGLEAMLGRDNCTHVPLEVFGQPFMLTQTVGKLANIAAECSELDHMAEGILKSFVAGDRMTFNRKNLSLIEATPTARLVMSANMRPRFADRTNAIWRRMLLVPWLIQIPESERVLGMDKVDWWEATGQLPGIFNWAIMGLARLRKEQRFTYSAICAEQLDDYRKEVNPTKIFLTENYEFVAETTARRTKANEHHWHLRTAGVYDNYKEWCIENGYKPMSDRTFGKEIARQFPGVERKRMRSQNSNERFYAYVWMTHRSFEEDGAEHSEEFDSDRFDLR